MKNKRHKRGRHERARTQRRRARRAAKRRTTRALSGRGQAPAPRLAQTIIPTDGSAPHFFDDCPICRAMRDSGATTDATGVVSMTPEQHAQYQDRLSAIVAEEGWPEDAMWISGEQMQRTFEEVNATLEANGYPTDTDAMDDDELDAHLQRVMDLISARELADRDRAAGGPGRDAGRRTWPPPGRRCLGPGAARPRVPRPETRADRTASSSLASSRSASTTSSSGSPVRSCLAARAPTAPAPRIPIRAAIERSVDLELAPPARLRWHTARAADTQDARDRPGRRESEQHAPKQPHGWRLPPRIRRWRSATRR